MKMKPAELRLSLCIVVVRKIAVDEHDIIGACCECLIPICELHFTRMNVKHQKCVQMFSAHAVRRTAKITCTPETIKQVLLRKSRSSMKIDPFFFYDTGFKSNNTLLTNIHNSTPNVRAKIAYFVHALHVTAFVSYDIIGTTERQETFQSFKRRRYL